MADEALNARELPPDTRSLAELLAERLDCSVGRWRVELEIEDGELRLVWRHERIGAGALGRFDER